MLFRPSCSLMSEQADGLRIGPGCCGLVWMFRGPRSRFWPRANPLCSKSKMAEEAAKKSVNWELAYLGVAAEGY